VDVVEQVPIAATNLTALGRLRGERQGWRARRAVILDTVGRSALPFKRNRTCKSARIVRCTLYSRRHPGVAVEHRFGNGR